MMTDREGSALRQQWMWVANWKMNPAPSCGVAAYLRIVASWLRPPWQVIICPSAPYLGLFQSMLHKQGEKHIGLGGQNLHHKERGSYTGEISGEMLRAMGCGYVLVGHSERRRYNGETAELVAAKIKVAQNNNLTAILCVGEEQNASGLWDGSILSAPLKEILTKLSPAAAARLIIAYEPQWAIGAAAPPSAQYIHRGLLVLRHTLEELWGDERASLIPLLYGGSITPDHQSTLFELPLLSGGLVGRACLDLAQWQQLLQGSSEACSL